MAEFQSFSEEISGFIEALRADLTSLFDALETGRKPLQEQSRMMLEMSEVTKSFSKTFKQEIGDSLRSALVEGKGFSEFVSGLGQSMSDRLFDQAISPVKNGLKSAMDSRFGNGWSEILPFADGAAFSQGRVMPFATGGVVEGATAFGMRGGGLGVMGEAGPEAIMPLARGPDGALGVRSAGGQAPRSVVINITTPDIRSFERSQSQIAAGITRALAAADRNR